MLSEIAKRKDALRSVEVKEATLAKPLLCEDSETYTAMMKETFLEEYFAEIEEFSFRSVFLDLSLESATAIHDAYKEWSKTSDKNNIDTVYASYPALAKLAAKLDEAATSLRTPCFFLRLSSRSPKDAVLYSTKAPKLFREYKAKLSATSLSSDTNNQMIALYETLTQAMRNSTGAEAVKLLMTSNRIQGDIEEFGMVPSHTPFQLIVREWFAFEVQHEYRAFIYQGKLTAITQYNEYCYFPYVHNNKKTIATLLDERIGEVMTKISLKNLVLDLILCFDEETEEWSLKVVEINPLAEFAGTGLFTWEDDRGTLLGELPFEFRVQEKEKENAFANLPDVWKAFLDQETAPQE